MHIPIRMSPFSWNDDAGGYYSVAPVFEPAEEFVAVAVEEAAGFDFGGRR